MGAPIPTGSFTHNGRRMRWVYDALEKVVWIGTLDTAKAFKYPTKGDPPEAVAHRHAAEAIKEIDSPKIVTPSPAHRQSSVIRPS